MCYRKDSLKEKRRSVIRLVSDCPESGPISELAEKHDVTLEEVNSWINLWSDWSAIAQSLDQSAS